VRAPIKAPVRVPVRPVSQPLPWPKFPMQPTRVVPKPTKTPLRTDSRGCNIFPSAKVADPDENSNVIDQHAEQGLKGSKQPVLDKKQEMDNKNFTEEMKPDLLALPRPAQEDA
jgi:hypothetical protein